MVHPRKARLLAQTLSWHKVNNFLRLYRSFYASKWKGISLHKGMPYKLGIEPTTHCNLRCPECPSGLRAFTRPTGLLEPEAFRHMVDQVYRELVYLLLYFQGEPYLNPNFLEMAAYARDKGIYTASSTNGHFLTANKAKETIESGLSELIISIDGTSQETYEQYRVGGKLSRVIEGITRLVEARKAANSLHPFIIIQFLVVRPNEHQIGEIQALGKQLGVDQVKLKTAQLYDFEAGNPLMPLQNRYSRYQQQADGRFRLKNRMANQCWKLWQGAEITWDGKVLPCCFDKDAQYEMGNLLERDFLSIWRGDTYEAFRNRLLQSRKEIDICRNCSEGTQVWA